MKKLILTICVLNVLFSCTIEKRLYNSGYHFEWKNKGRTSFQAKNELDLNQDKSSQIASVADNKGNDVKPESIQDRVIKTDFEEKDKFAAVSLNASEKKHLEEIVNDQKIENDDTLFIDAADIEGYNEPTRQQIVNHNILWIALNVIVVGLAVFLMILALADPILFLLTFMLILIPAVLILLLINIVFALTSPKLTAKKKVKEHIKTVEESNEEEDEERPDKRGRTAVVMGIFAAIIIGGIFYINSLTK